MKKKSILDCPVEFGKGDFLQLLSLSVGRMISVQTAFGEIIGDNGWNVDLKSGTIRFGENIFKSGVLGSESETGGTWLWAWANTEGGLPEIAAAPSRRARKLLADCAEFQNGKFMLDDIHTGHNLAMISCAVSEKNLCYYRCPYSGGAAFVTVENLPESVFEPVPAERFVRTLMDIISSFYCDHRLLAAGFLYQNGTDFVQSDSQIIAKFPEITLKLTFETAGGLSRLVDLHS